jgi:hypothetical protein
MEDIGELRAVRRDARAPAWGIGRVVALVATACLALVAVVLALNSGSFAGASELALQALGSVDVELEVEPVGHVIWLGSKLPNVKRVFLHRNQELLHQAGWKLKLWRSEDITQQNFPYTYGTIRRALKYHDESGENVFSMIGDLMKFEILYHFGGLYMDTNIELLRDPTELFTVAASLNKEVFLVADPGGDKRFASAGFMGALKKHSPLFASLVANEQYLNEIPFEEHCVANAWTGPMFLTLKVLHFDSAVILDRDTAYPLLCGQDGMDRCLERVGADATFGGKVDQENSVLVKEENGDVWRVKGAVRRHDARVPGGDGGGPLFSGQVVDQLQARGARAETRRLDAAVRARPRVVHLRLHAGPSAVEPEPQRGPINEGAGGAAAAAAGRGVEPRAAHRAGVDGA